MKSVGTSNSDGSRRNGERRPKLALPRIMSDPIGQAPLARLLTVVVITMYLIMMFGAVLANWDGGWHIAAAHHALAVFGGLVLVAAALVVVRPGHGWKVRLPLLFASMLYPVQAVIGGWLWWGGPSGLGAVHLAFAIIIFGFALYSLVWHLTGSSSSARTASAEPADSSVHESSAEGGADGPERRLPSGIVGVARAYVSLTKPRLMWLLSLLALAGMSLATLAGAALGGITVVATLAGGVLAIGASGTFNHVLERDRDRRMDRTKDRPLASNEVPPGRATGFGITLAVVGLSLLWLFTTPLATVLTAIAIVYYSVIYTVVLKPNTTWNIAIGGGAGALPAVIGWAAVTGDIGIPALLLAAIVVLWTPAHFYNLAILHREDYARGGYPMLPVVAGIAITRRRIGYALGATFIGTASLGGMTALGLAFLVLTAVGGAVFLAFYAEQLIHETPSLTYRTFHASNLFLGLLLIAIVVESVL